MVKSGGPPTFLSQLTERDKLVGITETLTIRLFNGEGERDTDMQVFIKGNKYLKLFIITVISSLDNCTEGNTSIYSLCTPKHT